MHKLPKFLFTIALAFVAFAVSAQVQISVGPRVGINLANFSVDDEEEIGELDNRLGFLAGVVGEFRFSENLALQSELGFIQKGAKSEFSFEDPQLGTISEEANFIFNYLEVPVLFKAGTSFGQVRLDGLIGPSFGYAMSAKGKYKTTIGGETEEEEESIDFDDEGISRFDLGLQFGAILGIDLSETAQIFVDGRYLLGLSNLNEDSEDGDIKNKGLAFSAGVLFDL